MGVRRSSHLAIQPDGRMARVATTEPAPDEQESRQLGDRFEELMEDKGRKDEARVSEAETARREMPVRPPWRPNREAAARATAEEEAKSAPSKGPDDKTPELRDRQSSARAEPAAQHQERSAHGKQPSDDDQSGGQQSGQGSDTSGAMMAMQADLARPSSEGREIKGEAPAAVAGHDIKEIANQVAARISAGRHHGISQVRIDLREDLLPGTSMKLEDRSDAVVVSVGSDSQEAAELIADHAVELGRAISQRTGRRTRIELGDKSWTTESDEP